MSLVFFPAHYLSGASSLWVFLLHYNAVMLGAHASRDARCTPSLGLSHIGAGLLSHKDTCMYCRKTLSCRAGEDLEMS